MLNAGNMSSIPESDRQNTECRITGCRKQRVALDLTMFDFASNIMEILAQLNADAHADESMDEVVCKHEFSVSTRESVTITF